MYLSLSAARYISLCPQLDRYDTIDLFNTHSNNNIFAYIDIELRHFMHCLIAARDVVSGLHDEQVHTSDDFLWISQLRYYWEKQAVMVRMITTTVPYGYEYLGNTGRLVITPLTDRCYRSVIYRYIQIV